MEANYTKNFLFREKSIMCIKREYITFHGDSNREIFEKQIVCIKMEYVTPLF